VVRVPISTWVVAVTDGHRRRRDLTADGGLTAGETVGETPTSNGAETADDGAETGDDGAVVGNETAVVAVGPPGPVPGRDETSTTLAGDGEQPSGGARPGPLGPRWPRLAPKSPRKPVGASNLISIK
jgi:hypothetical protein